MNKYNQADYNNLKEALNFELVSFIGRTFKKNKGKISTEKSPVLLDLGAGNNFSPGWLHADFYTFRIKFWKKSDGQRKPEIELDLRYPLNCPSNSIDGIYTSHTLEHLNYQSALNLLNEIYRILKPECYLRLIVPDIEKAVNLYTGKERNMMGYRTGCEAISDFTQNWGHKSAWDEILLKVILADIGFKNIRKVEFGKGGIERRLIKEQEARRRDSLVIEAIK